jgi:outer membrane protein assembly factor BamB
MNTPLSTPSSTWLSLTGLACAMMLATGDVRGDEAAWPQFRGPDSNPVSTNARLAETWGKTENVEWSAEIPGRGWSSPIVTGEKVLITSATTDGPSKSPQIGTEYSNEYVAELTKQGLSEAQVLEKVTGRDIELPNEVQLHYVLSCRNLKTGTLEWQREFYAGRPPGGRHRKNSFVSETPVTDGKSVFVYVANLGLYAFDLKGKPVWSTPQEALPIYLDFGTGSSPLFAVRPGAAGDISLKQDERANEHVAWSEPRGGTYLPTAVAHAGALYSVTETGVLSRFDAKSGTLIYKTRIDPAATAFTSSPWAYNGKVFFLSEEGQTFVVAAGGPTRPHGCKAKLALKAKQWHTPDADRAKQVLSMRWSDAAAWGTHGRSGHNQCHAIVATLRPSLRDRRVSSPSSQAPRDPLRRASARSTRAARRSASLLPSGAAVEFRQHELVVPQGFRTRQPAVDGALEHQQRCVARLIEIHLDP